MREIDNTNVIYKWNNNYKILYHVLDYKYNEKWRAETQ